MLNEKLDALIMESMKSKEKDRLKVFKLIKTKFQEFKTAKNAKPLDEAAEIQILKKMVDERQKSIEAYKSGGRQDLVDEEKKEIDIISEFLPKPVSEEDIKKCLKSLSIPRTKPFMGQLIKEIKRLLPGADGKLVSDIVKENLEE